MTRRRNARNATAASATPRACVNVGACGQGKVSKTVSEVYRNRSVSVEHFAVN
jgi:hypothetical protein